MEQSILVVALAVLGFALFARRVQGSSLTMPMVFTAAGLVLGPAALGVLDVELGNAVISGLAEAALVVVLFTDASRMDLRTVLRQHSLALRLLLVGLPLAIAVGTVASLLLLPTLPLAAATLLAITLAPTDAALGQSFVTNRAVPQRIRQTLNVESGLNDGLAVPFLTLFLDIARHETDSAARYALLLAQLVGLGVLTGVVIGWLGGRLLLWSARRDWATEASQRLATIAVAAVAYAASEVMGGNGFVATFVAGLVIGTTARPLLRSTTTFAEAEGQLLSLLTFLLFGSVIAADVLGHASWALIAYALVSLLVVRPLATALALLGTHVSPVTVGFIGWAGPRGLASIVYAVLVAETAGLDEAGLVFQAAGWTILLSIVLHGLTAGPVSSAYARYAARRHAEAPEHQPVSPLPVRVPLHRPGAPVTH